MAGKEIIIDDVDISGCEYCLKMTKYRCTIQRDVYKCLCEENPNCHYKQLKRKEQECEKLKSDLTDLSKIIDCKNGTILTFKEQLDQLKAENEKLKQENKHLKDIINKSANHLC